MKLAVALATLAVAAPLTSAQEAGDWAAGIAVGTGDRAGFFVRYYPVADAGAEVHVLLVPIFDLFSIGAGVGVVAHPIQDERVSVYLGGHGLASQFLGGGARRYGFTLGAGYEPFRAEEFTGRFMGRVSLSLVRREAFGTEARLSDVPDATWSPWHLRLGGQVGTGRVDGIDTAE
jgi:hypothetical protein